MTSHARRVARSAVIHGLPAVDLHRHLVSSALDRLSPEYQAPVNDLVEIGMGTDPAAPRPSSAGRGSHWWYSWLDLRAEPVVLRVPGAPEGRRVRAELVDLRGASLALRWSPDGPGGAVGIRGPRWHGSEPAPPIAVECPTDLALLLIAGRSHDGHDDGGPHGHPGLHTLSTWLGRPTPTPLPPAVPDLAVVDVRAPLDAHFLHILSVMIPLMPARPEEERLRAELASIGIGEAPVAALPGPDAPSTSDLEAGLADGVAEVRHRCRTIAPGDGAPLRHRELHADYLSRAAASYLGMYQPEQHLQVLASAAS